VRIGGEQLPSERVPVGHHPDQHGTRGAAARREGRRGAGVRHPD